MTVKQRVEWPRAVGGKPLTTLFKTVQVAPGEPELPECQICGCLIAMGGHEPDCGDRARALLGWALGQLAEAGIEPNRNTLDHLRSMPTKKRRKHMTRRQLNRIVRSIDEPPEWTL